MNEVRLEGLVVQEPRSRELPSGLVIWHIEVQTYGADGCETSVPVVADGAFEPGSLQPGDKIRVNGCVQRRFFRAGGVTQSRVEIVAQELWKVDS